MCLESSSLSHTFHNLTRKRQSCILRVVHRFHVWLFAIVKTQGQVEKLVNEREKMKNELKEGKVRGEEIKTSIETKLDAVREMGTSARIQGRVL